MRSLAGITAANKQLQWVLSVEERPAGSHAVQKSQWQWLNYSLHRRVIKGQLPTSSTDFFTMLPVTIMSLQKWFSSRHFPDFCQLPDISPTAIKFPDSSRLSRQVITPLKSSVMKPRFLHAYLGCRRRFRWRHQSTTTFLFFLDVNVEGVHLLKLMLVNCIPVDALWQQQKSPKLPPQSRINDRPNALPSLLTLILTYDLDFQSPAICAHYLYTHAKNQVKGHAIQKLEWKQIEGQTDRGDFITGTFVARWLGSRVVARWTRVQKGLTSNRSCDAVG